MILCVCYRKIRLLRASRSIQLLSLNNRDSGTTGQSHDPSCYGRASVLYENKCLSEEKQIKSLRQSLRELEDGLSVSAMARQ